MPDKALSHPTPADDARTPDDAVERVRNALNEARFSDGDPMIVGQQHAARQNVISHLAEMVIAPILTASGDARERALREAAQIAANHEPTLVSEGDIITAEGETKASEAIERAILALLAPPPAQEEGK